MKLRPLTRSDVSFSFTGEVMEEDTRPDFQSGDPEYKEEDDRLELEALERLAKGDVWAWACVKVTAQWGSFSASTYLGGCSYKDEEEFISSGELASLEDDVLYKLNDTLESIFHRLSTLVEA